MLRTIERYLFAMATKLNDFRMRRIDSMKRKIQRKKALIAALEFQAGCDRLRLAPR